MYAKNGPGLRFGITFSNQRIWYMTSIHANAFIPHFVWIKNGWQSPNSLSKWMKFIYVVIASLAFYVQLKYFREFSYYFMHEAETFRVQTNSDLQFIP